MGDGRLRELVAHGRFDLYPVLQLALDSTHNAVFLSPSIN